MKKKRGSAGAVRLDQELEGAEVPVAGRGGERERGVPDRLAQGVGQAGRGRDLDQLLVAPLEAAVPVAEVDDGAAPVAGDLDLDVADRGQQLLDEHALVAEGGPGLGDRPAVGVFDLVRGRHDPHAAAAASADRLDQHRGAGRQTVEEGARLVQRHRLGHSGDHRHAVLLRQRPRPRLVAEQLQRLGRRPHEAQPRFMAGAREPGVLAQEAVARMDRVAAVLGGGPQQLLAVEVGGRPGAGQRRRLAGPADVERLGVVLGERGDGRNVQLRRGAGYADRDLAAVGDQELHRSSISGSEGPLSYAACSRPRTTSESGNPTR